MRTLPATLLAVLALQLPALADEPKPVPLPAPQTEGGKPLMQALRARRTSREFSAEKLSPQTLSNLLWAAFGISRPEKGGRTAPSAMNWQEIDVYVVTADGSFVYDAKANALRPVAKGDLRGLGGTQPFVKDAPVTLVFVADHKRMAASKAADGEILAAEDAAFVSENVYLFCSSEGLATGVRASVDRPALAKALGLRAEQTIVLAQSVAMPAAAAR
jgi:nitroreductase